METEYAQRYENLTETIETKLRKLLQEYACNSEVFLDRVDAGEDIRRAFVQAGGHAPWFSEMDAKASVIVGGTKRTKTESFLSTFGRRAGKSEANRREMTVATTQPGSNPFHPAYVEGIAHQPKQMSDHDAELHFYMTSQREYDPAQRERLLLERNAKIMAAEPDRMGMEEVIMRAIEGCTEFPGATVPMLVAARREIERRWVGPGVPRDGGKFRGSTVLLSKVIKGMTP